MTDKIKLPLKTLEVLDSEPVEVQNPLSGDTTILTPEAVAVYDFIKGSEMLGMYGKEFDKCLHWFQKHFPKEYMVLLD